MGNDSFKSCLVFFYEKIANLPLQEAEIIPRPETEIWISLKEFLTFNCDT